MPTNAPLTRSDVRMIVAVGLPSLAAGLFLPLTLVYFTVLTDIPLERLGLLLSVAALLTVPIPLLTGWLADKYGASVVVAVALCVQCVGFAGMTVARDDWSVFAVSLTIAAANRTYWSAIFTVLATHADATGARTHEWWFGAANVSRTIGITVGSLVTGAVLIADREALYVAVAAAASVCLLLAAGTLPRMAHQQGSGHLSPRELLSAARDVPYVAYVAVNAVFALSILFVGTSLPITIKDGLEGPGWLTASLLTFNAVVVAVLGLRAARWTQRRSRAWSLSTAGVLWMVAYALAAVGASQPLWVASALLGVAVLGIAAAEAVHAPSSMAWAAEMAPDKNRGRYLALFQYSWLIAEVAAPLVFATLFVREAWLPFAVVAGANAVAVLALPWVARAVSTRHAPAVS
jgi:MFS family permease